MWTKQKLGVAAWTLGQRPLPGIAARIQALNYDGLTLTIDPERDTAVTIKQTLNDHNLELFAIAPPEVDVAASSAAMEGRCAACQDDAFWRFPQPSPGARAASINPQPGLPNANQGSPHTKKAPKGLMGWMCYSLASNAASNCLTSMSSPVDSSASARSASGSSSAT